MWVYFWSGVLGAGTFVVGWCLGGWWARNRWCRGRFRLPGPFRRWRG